VNKTGANFDVEVREESGDGKYRVEYIPAGGEADVHADLIVPREGVAASRLRRRSDKRKPWQKSDDRDLAEMYSARVTEDLQNRTSSNTLTYGVVMPDRSTPDVLAVQPLVEAGDAHRLVPRADGNLEHRAPEYVPVQLLVAGIEAAPQAPSEKCFFTKYSLDLAWQTSSLQRARRAAR